MKYVLAVLIPLLIIGGVVFGLMYSKVGPFAPAKKTTKASQQTSTPSTTTNTSRFTPSNASSNLTSDTSSYPASMKSSSSYPGSSMTASVYTPEPNADENAAHLASVYEQMQPQDAVKILAKLPDPIVVKLLGKMDSMQVSKILPLLPVDRSVRITKELMK